MTRATSDAPAVLPSGTELPQRELRYEGFPLEAVLARVHAAHGADVTITAADRVRRGGIGGFFARELFQVTVTVPVPSATEPNFVPLGRMSIFGDDVRTFSDDIAILGEEDRDYDEIDPEDVDGALGLTTPAVRDERDAEIWALLAAAATAAPAPATGPAARPEVAPAPAVAAPVAAPTPVAEPVPAPFVVPEPVAEPVPAPFVVPEIVAPIVSSGPIASTVLIPAFTYGRNTGPAPAAMPTPVLVASAAPVDLDRLISRFEAVPPAYELPPAGIIAVVGTRGEALQAAGRLATSLGIPTDDVIVASPPADIVVPTADDTMRLAATTRFRCNPIAVIVLELVPGRQGHEWVRVVLDGLRAEQVRLAVDAGRLLAHQHLSIAAVGGVDVIDLLNATEHHDPAAALDLRTPIATIDGRPATPELWAATALATALAAGANPPMTVDRSVVGTR